MPIYLYKCEVCGSKVEMVQGITGAVPFCCGKSMTKLPTSPAIIRIKGMGGKLARNRGYKEGYSKEYLRDVSPETQ